MKTAELTQIIEEGNLANSSTHGSAGIIRQRYDQRNECDNGLSSSIASIPRYGNSNSRSVNNNSEIVQQHDITSSFLQ